MSDEHDPDVTADVPPAEPDNLDAGLAAAFGPPPGAQAAESILASLRPSYGLLRPVLLRDAPDDSGHLVRPHSDAMPELHETGSRYQLSGELARGGMGAVLRGRDVDLGRDLAVKVLLEKHARRTDIVRRFLEEAQVGAQLQHPGVVPVYDVGRFGDRPFFTMKLVKGRTLSALLAERAEPADDQPRFLANLLQVAQTLAYAHAKGVIHRDLKPANIMIGSFGEVQVMDWGLAKVLTEGGVADEEQASRGRQSAPTQATVIRTARSGSSGGHGSETEAGSLLGTPAYMPPEQANGEVERLDRRADVFGLGAILCEILIGRPPYVGRSVEEVRRKAANGDQAEALAQLDACGADTELVALARACLSPEPIDRPRDAQAVAGGLSSYLNGVQERLRSSEIERAKAVVKVTEERKRRRVQLALAASILALVLVGGGGAWWLRERQLEASRGVEAALAEADRLRSKGQFPVALAAARRAEALLPGAPRNWADRVHETVADIETIDALQQARLRTNQTASVAAGTDGYISVARAFDYAGADAAYAAAFRRYGVTANAELPAETVGRLRQSTIREDLAIALDGWAGVRNALNDPDGKRRLIELAQAIDENPFRQRLRVARLANDRAAFRALAAEPGLAALPASHLVLLATNLRNHDDQPLAEAILRQAQRWHPDDFSVNYELADLLANKKPVQLAEALRFATAALALRPDSPRLLGWLVYLHGQMHDFDEAIGCLRQTLALDPKAAWAYCELGNTLLGKKETDAAIASYRQAIELDPKSAIAYNGLGNALYGERNGMEGALRAYRRAIELDPKLAVGHANIGNVLMGKDDVDGAMACYRRAIGLDAKLAMAYNGLGNALRIKKDPDEALVNYRKAIELEPTAAIYYMNLGTALRDKGDVEGAIAAHRRAIALDARDAMAHFNLGNALWAGKKDLDGAIASYRRAIEIKPTYAAAYGNLSAALQDKGATAEAASAALRAIELDPRQGRILTAILAPLGRLEEARAVWGKALAHEPPEHDAWYGYAELCLFLGHEDDYQHARGALLRKFGDTTNPVIAERTARACLLLPASGDTLRRSAALAERAVATGAEHPFYPYFLVAKGLAAYRQGQFDPAAGNIHAALQRFSGEANLQANARLVLALIQQRQGQTAQARKSLAAGALSLGADNHDSRIGHILRREAERLIGPMPLRDAETQILHNLTAFLKGDYQPRDNDERLLLLGVCQSRRLHETAARLCGEILTTDPHLTADLKAAFRYNAACSAALAASGKASDAPADAAERALLRQQALDWLRADLTLYAKRLPGTSAADRQVICDRLRLWQQDSDLAGVRDEKALAELPSGVRLAWRTLWADVVAMLKRAQKP